MGWAGSCPQCVPCVMLFPGLHSSVVLLMLLMIIVMLEVDGMSVLRNTCILV